MKKIINITLRIIAVPLLLGIVLIKYNYHAIRHLILFVRYGGEWITYTKDDNNTIQDIYLELKKTNKIQENESTRNNY